jgi:hypothetical protein
MAGAVGAGGDIRACQCSQRLDGFLPGFAMTKVAAVDQEIGIRRQAPTDLLKLFGVARADRLLRQEARAEMHLGFGAIAD